MIKKLFIAILWYNYTSFACDYMIDTFANQRIVAKSIKRVANKYDNTIDVQFNNEAFSNLDLTMKIAVFLTKYRIHVDKKCDDICKNFPMFSPENRKYRQSIYSVIPSEIMRAFFKIDYENIFDLKRYCPIEQWSQSNFNYLTLLAFIFTRLHGSTQTYKVQDVLRENIECHTYKKYETKFIEAENQINKYINAFDIKHYIVLMEQMVYNGCLLDVSNTNNKITCTIYNDSNTLHDYTRLVYTKYNSLLWSGICYSCDNNRLMTYYKKYCSCSEDERANKISLINGFIFGINNDSVGQLSGTNDIVLDIISEYSKAKFSVFETFVDPQRGDLNNYSYNYYDYCDILEDPTKNNLDKSINIENNIWGDPEDDDAIEQLYEYLNTLITNHRDKMKNK